MDDDERVHVGNDDDVVEKYGERVSLEATATK